MCGNLEHRVGRRVDDRAATAHVLLAKMFEYFGAGRVAIAEHTGQLGLFNQRLQQFVREAVLQLVELTERMGHGYTSGFPVARRCVFAAGTFAGIAPQAFRRRQPLEAGSCVSMCCGVRLRQA